SAPGADATPGLGQRRHANGLAGDRLYRYHPGGVSAAAVLARRGRPVYEVPAGHGDRLPAGLPGHGPGVSAGARRGHRWPTAAAGHPAWPGRRWLSPPAENLAEAPGADPAGHARCDCADLYRLWP